MPRVGIASMPTVLFSGKSSPTINTMCEINTNNPIYSCNNYPEQPERLLSHEIHERHKSPHVYGTMFRSAARAATAISERSNNTTPRTPMVQADKRKTLTDSGKPLLDFPSSPGEGVTTAKEVGSWLSFAVLGLGVML